MFPDVTRDDVFRMDTRRLWLRWPRAADTQAFLAWSGNGDLAAVTRGSRLPDAAEIERFILAARAENAAGTSLCLTVTQKGAGRPPVGAIALHASPEGGRIDLGLTVAPAFRRRGFAAEVLASAMPAVFGLTTTLYVAADLRAADATARRLLQRFGFARVDDTRMRLEQRSWQRHHVVKRIPAMTHQISLRPDRQASTLDA